MADLLVTQRAFRKRLLDNDREAARELVQVYADLQRAIADELDALTRAIRQAQAAGITVNQSWLFQQDRYRSLLQQAAEAHARASAQAAGTVSRTQSTARSLGIEAAEQLVRSLAPPQVALSWSQLPTGALEAAVGFASDGSPLRALFDQLGPEASANMRRSLLRGIGLGHSPRRIAAGIRRANGLALTRALTISRTEVLRAYRQAQSDSYARNKDILRGKVWHAALGERTCTICLANHGAVFPIDAIMATHPNCRCSWVPVTKSWAELGYEGIEDTNPKIERGSDWLTRQPIERQVAILGRERAAAFRNGMSLGEMVGTRVDRRWGRVAFIRPLRDVMAARLPMAVGAEGLGVQRALPGFDAPDLLLTRVARQFETIEDGARWAMTNMDDLTKLPKARREAIRDYTGGGYRVTNDYLRGTLRQTTADEFLEGTAQSFVDKAYAANVTQAKTTIRALDRAMQPLPEDITLHRTVNDMAFQKYLKPLGDESWDLAGMRNLTGQVIREPGYLSTNVGPGVLDSYASRPVHMHITAPKGTPAAWVNDVSVYQNQEYEMLLGAGRNMLITRTELIDGTWQVYGTILP